MANAKTDVVVLTGSLLSMAGLAGVYSLAHGQWYEKKGGGDLFFDGNRWEIYGGGEWDDLKMVSGSSTAVTPDLVNGWYYDTCDDVPHGKDPMSGACVVKYTPGAAQEACRMLAALRSK